jgi:hypothetical protein
MNIDVNSVSHQTAWSGALPLTPGCPSQASWPSAVVPHSLPGWVIS